jgi:hypothetical protein
MSTGDEHPCEACHYPVRGDQRLCGGCREWKFVCRECDEVVSRDFESPDSENLCTPCDVER